MYFINPPTFVSDVPKFLRKRAVVSSVKKMIDWATAEYMSAISYYQKVGDERSVKLIQKHFTRETVMSKHPDFKRMCQTMTMDFFNCLDRQDRRFLTDAYNVAHSRLAAQATP